MDLLLHTTKGDFLGIVSWNRSESLRLPPNSTVIFENVSGILTPSGEALGRFLLTREVSVQRGILVLEVSGVDVSVDFSISKLKF
ncbi:MAG: hypothetical protein D6698_11460 [Gammaproteobacteria bacterium]|nr:MAG: hypothetical protein D6698_11460 [Gammaproteobacteria bacterium]